MVRGVRFALWLLILICWLPLELRGDAAEEQRKRELFLRMREDIRALQPDASPTPKPQPVPRPASTPPPPQSVPKPAPKPALKATPIPSSPSPPTPPKQTSPPKPKVQPTPKSTPPPAPVVKSTPAPQKKSTATVTKSPSKEPTKAPIKAPITVEKSGLQKEKGLVPPTKSSGGLFGSRYKYLTPSVRKAIDNAKVQKGRWKYVIVHNSGTRQGNAKAFHIYHLRTRKMANGLAYHFVIGNGHGSGDGEIEIGSRWTRQINGGHVASDYLNNISLGICLVGDFNRDKPTPAQLASLNELIAYLRQRVGKHKGKLAEVKVHREINPRPTDCPGTKFPVQWLHQKFK